MTHTAKQLVPKVSVAMITYNHERFIAQALESVLMQKTDFQIELIIGEDCSTDGTRKIVKKYADLKPDIIRPFFYSNNCGVQKNLATVLKACRSDYIACLEGDDYWTDPRKLQKQVAFMERNAQCSMCGSAVMDIHVSPDGKEREVGLYPERTTKTLFSLEDVIIEYPFRTLTFMLRNGLVKLPEWFERVPYGDMSLLALYGAKGPIGFMSEVTGNYRKHVGGVYSSLSLFEKHKALGKTLDLLNAHFSGQYFKVFGERDFRFSKLICRQAIYAGCGGDARKIYWESFRRFAACKPISYAALGFSIFAWHPLKKRVAIRERLQKLSKSFKYLAKNNTTL